MVPKHTDVTFYIMKCICISFIIAHGFTHISEVFYYQFAGFLDQWHKYNRTNTNVNVLTDIIMDYKEMQPFHDHLREKMAFSVTSMTSFEREALAKMNGVIKDLEKIDMLAATLNSFLLRLISTMIEWLLCIFLQVVYLFIIVLELFSYGNSKIKLNIFLLALTFNIPFTVKRIKYKYVFPKNSYGISYNDEESLVVYHPPADGPRLRFVLLHYFVIWLLLVLEPLIKRRLMSILESVPDQKQKSQNVTDQMKLHQFCIRGDKEGLKVLLQKYSMKLDINALDIGNTPLHVAVSGTHSTIVQMLLSHYKDQIDTSIRNYEGHNALDIAVTKKNMNIVNMLIKVFAPENSSLLLAVKSDQEKMVYLLKSRISESLISGYRLYLDRYYGYLIEFKKKDIEKSRKEKIKKNLDSCKQMLLQCLQATDKQLKMSKSDQLKLEFECPICSEEMDVPTQIFACSNDHYICSECLEMSEVQTCPICREDFTTSSPKRRKAAEKLLQIIKSSHIPQEYIFDQLKRYLK